MLELQRWLYVGATSQLKGFSSVIEPRALLIGTGIAAIFGFVHALMPGHGKTVLVSYFLGRPGSIRAGLTTSVILVLTHVGSAVVIVLAGFIALRATIGGAGRAPAFETTSAAFILLIGIWLLYNALRRRHGDPGLQNGRKHGVGNGGHNCRIRNRDCLFAPPDPSLFGKYNRYPRAYGAGVRIRQRGCDYWIGLMASYWSLSPQGNTR